MFKKLSLELGASCPVVILPDTVHPRASDLLVSQLHSYVNAGGRQSVDRRVDQIQSCRVRILRAVGQQHRLLRDSLDRMLAHLRANEVDVDSQRAVDSAEAWQALHEVNENALAQAQAAMRLVHAQVDVNRPSDGSERVKNGRAHD